MARNGAFRHGYSSVADRACRAFNSLGRPGFSNPGGGQGKFAFVRRLLAAVSLAIVIHLLKFLVAYSLAKALQIPITYRQVIVIGSAGAFCITLPVTINGHGLREFLLVAYFTQAGLTSHACGGNMAREVAIAWSLLVVIYKLLWSIPGRSGI